MDRIPNLRAGIGTGLEDDPNQEAADNFVATSMGLITVFSEEALKTAGRYALAHNRTVVTDEDVAKALKFQARMFFQRVENLEGRVQDAVEEFWSAMAEEEEDGEETHAKHAWSAARWMLDEHETAQTHFSGAASVLNAGRAGSWPHEAWVHSP